MQLLILAAAAGFFQEAGTVQSKHALQPWARWKQGSFARYENFCDGKPVDQWVMTLLDMTGESYVIRHQVKGRGSQYDWEHKVPYNDLPTPYWSEFMLMPGEWTWSDKGEEKLTLAGKEYACTVRETILAKDHSARIWVSPGSRFPLRSRVERPGLKWEMNLDQETEEVAVGKEKWRCCRVKGFVEEASQGVLTRRQSFTEWLSDEVTGGIVREDVLDEFDLAEPARKPVQYSMKLVEFKAIRPDVKTVK